MLEGQLCTYHYSIFISLMDKLGVQTVKRSKACFIFLNKMFASVSLPRVMSAGKGPEGMLKGMSSQVTFTPPLSTPPQVLRIEFTALQMLSKCSIY